MCDEITTPPSSQTQTIIELRHEIERLRAAQYTITPSDECSACGLSASEIAARRMSGNGCNNEGCPMLSEFKPMRRGGMEHDWQHWSLVYQRRLRKLKKLIAAQGYDIVSDEDGMPTALERNKP
jgi:hypothetical protein